MSVIILESNEVKYEFNSDIQQVNFMLMTDGHYMDETISITLSNLALKSRP